MRKNQKICLATVGTLSILLGVKAMRNAVKKREQKGKKLNAIIFGRAGRGMNRGCIKPCVERKGSEVLSQWEIQRCLDAIGGKETDMSDM